MQVIVNSYCVHHYDGRINLESVLGCANHAQLADVHKRAADIVDMGPNPFTISVEITCKKI